MTISSANRFAAKRESAISKVLWGTVAAFLLLVSSASAADNLVVNGSFESGNTGFTHSGTYTYVSGPPYPASPGGMYAEGTLTVYSNPQTTHSSWVNMTAFSGSNMLIVNGSSTTGVAVWESATPFTIETNTLYFFEAYVANVFAANGAKLTFQVFGNDTNVWDDIATADLSGAAAGTWNVVGGETQDWLSGNNTTAKLRILNAQPALNGNDFALDVVTFSKESVVPEPSTLLLMLGGAAAAFLARRRRSVARA